jgi:hypothetical protein
VRYAIKSPSLSHSDCATVGSNDIELASLGRPFAQGPQERKLRNGRKRLHQVSFPSNGKDGSAPELLKPLSCNNTRKADSSLSAPRAAGPFSSRSILRFLVEGTEPPQITFSKAREPTLHITAYCHYTRLQARPLLKCSLCKDRNKLSQWSALYPTSCHFPRTFLRWRPVNTKETLVTPAAHWSNDQTHPWTRNATTLVLTGGLPSAIGCKGSSKKRGGY